MNWNKGATVTAVIADRPIDLPVIIDSPDAEIEGDWSVPLHPKGTILIVNCTDSGRFSRRNRQLAHHLYDDGFAILILDLLTHAEEVENNLTGAVQVDLPMFADRITSAAKWVSEQDQVGQLPLGVIASGAASAGALIAASKSPEMFQAIVSKNGRPDLAGIRLHKVMTPCLMIVGASDKRCSELNRWALRRLDCDKNMVTVPGSGHFFEEPGAIETVAELASTWFARYMKVRLPRGKSIFSLTWTDRPRQPVLVR